MTIHDKNPAIKYYSQDVFSYGYAIGTFSDSNNPNQYRYSGTTEHESGILAHHFEPKNPDSLLAFHFKTKTILDHVDNWNDDDSGRLRHRFGTNSDIWNTNELGYVLRDGLTHRCLNPSRSATRPLKTLATVSD